MPMKMGYPVIKSVMPFLNAGFNWKNEKKAHYLETNFTCSNTLKTDNGLGNNYILKKDNSRFLKADLKYGFYASIFRLDKYGIEIGPVIGLEYQQRLLDYKSGVELLTSDINFIIGPDLLLYYDDGKNTRLGFSFISLFYIPYLNKGHLERKYSDGQLINESAYRAFYYRTLFKLAVTRRISEAGSISLGLEKDDTVGFANSDPIFYIDDLVHFRLNRTYRAYLRYYFND
jgi:hypothetical protein